MRLELEEQLWIAPFTETEVWAQFPGFALYLALATISKHSYLVKFTTCQPDLALISKSSSYNRDAL